jgi:hypothetical protein
MVCEWFGLKTTQTVFTGLTSKSVVTVFASLASKLVATVSSDLASKPVATVFAGLTSKPAATVFASLASKLVATVSWFGPQNQVGFGLLVAPKNRRREVSVGHALISSSLLGMEASLTRVFQSGLKTGGGATTGGARGTIMEVASEAN